MVGGWITPLLLAMGCGSGQQATSPNSIDAAYERALELSQAGEYERATEAWTELIKLDPESPAHYGNRANCYSYLNKLDLALKDYEESIARTIALSGDPNDPRLSYSYFNRGRAYDKQGQPGKALEDYEHGVHPQQAG